jgi:hypothetical protein
LGLFIIIFTYPQWKALASFNFSPKEINVPVIKIGYVERSSLEKSKLDRIKKY